MSDARLKAVEMMYEALDYYACSVAPDFLCARQKQPNGECIDAVMGTCGKPAALAQAAYDAALKEGT